MSLNSSSQNIFFYIFQCKTYFSIQKYDNIKGIKKKKQYTVQVYTVYTFF